MEKKLSKTLEFLKTTAIGGVLFMLPFAGLVFLLGYVYKIVLAVYKVVDSVTPIHSTLGIAILFVISIAIIILVCFVTGLLASRSIAKQSSVWLEGNLLKVFPKYAIYKDILTGTLGGSEAVPSLKPIRVRMQGIDRLAFETNRLDDGTVVVYFPGAPDPWSGFLGNVPADQVEPISISFNEAVGQIEQLGRPKPI